MKRIKLISATIRPDVWMHNYKHWIANAKDMEIVDTFVSVNLEDHKKEILEKYPNVNVVVCGDNLGVCRPIYEITKDLEGNDDDILLAFFDDVFCIKEWDKYILNKFKNYSGAIMINDGVQHPDPNQAPLIVAITMPCMDLATLRKLNNIIFNPEYAHYYADNEVYNNLLEMKLLRDDRVEDSTTFLHKHYYKINEQKSDEIDQRIVDKCAIPDREIYKMRMRLPLEERLKLKSNYRDGDRMNILVIPDRLEVRGGLETHVASLAKEWAKKNNVLIYSNAISKEYQLELGSCSLSNGWNDKNTKYIIDRFKPDVIIAHPFSGVNLALEIKKELPEVKVFVTMHGDYTIESIKSDEIEKIFCVSKTAFNACKTIVPEEKLEIIYNGVNIKDFYPTNKSKIVSKALKFNNKFKTLVAITRLQDGKELPVKQLLQIINPLADRVAGLNVAIVGGGSQLDNIKELAKQIQNKPNLNLAITGEIENVRSYINLADIVLGCDRVAIEAILCDKNVFYMGLPKWKGLIKNDNYEEIIFSKQGFADITNDDLCNHLVWMLTRKEELKQNYTNELKDKITEICDIKKIANKYLERFEGK